MLKSEKIQFVKTTSEYIVNRIIQDIESGKVPSNWEGLELRWLLENRFVSEYGHYEKKRKKEYINDVLVNGL